MSCTYLIGYTQNFDASTQEDNDWQWSCKDEIGRAQQYYKQLYDAHFQKKKVAGIALLTVEFELTTGASSSSILLKAMHKLTTTIHYNQQKNATKVTLPTTPIWAMAEEAVSMEQPPAPTATVASEFPEHLLIIAYEDYFQ